MELAQAAQANGVRKMIHTSSAGIIGLQPDRSPGDDQTPPWSGTMKNLYLKSKVRDGRAPASPTVPDLMANGKREKKIIVLLTDASSENVPSCTSFEPPGRASFHTGKANSKRRGGSFSCRLS